MQSQSISEWDELCLSLQGRTAGDGGRREADVNSAYVGATERDSEKLRGNYRDVVDCLRRKSGLEQLSAYVFRVLRVHAARHGRVDSRYSRYLMLVLYRLGAFNVQCPM